MTLLHRSDENDFNEIISLITDLYPNEFVAKNIIGVYLKKLNDADLLQKNKSVDAMGNTTHIAITTKSINFFKEILGDSLVSSNDLENDQEKYFEVNVDSKYGDLSTADAFVSTQCAIWVIPKNDSNQIGLSKKGIDGSEFQKFRRDLFKDDILIFFKYIKENSINYYAISLKKDDDKLKRLSFQTDQLVVIKYFDTKVKSLYTETRESKEHNLSFTDYEKIVGFNKIYYGAPGSGKSYNVKSEYENEFSTRILFHENYEYSDFVGHIKPILIEKDEKKFINYEFVNGPFTKILIESLKDRSRMFVLIIEEINRANAPSVFGDLFQLLDRNDKGISEYSIHNQEIYDQIKKELASNYPYENGIVFIPNNLSIVATMNNSDQNTVTLDTAFKRRWQYNYTPIDFMNHPFSNKLIPNFNISWVDFVQSINEFMFSDLNRDMMLSEDKQLGQFFVKESDLENFSLFAYKVLFYLWDDVFKYNRDRIFKENILTLNELVNLANTQGIGVFCGELYETLSTKVKYEYTQ